VGWTCVGRVLFGRSNVFLFGRTQERSEGGNDCEIHWIGEGVEHGIDLSVSRNRLNQIHLRGRAPEGWLAVAQTANPSDPLQSAVMPCPD
jgi:hypothetical protein